MIDSEVFLGEVLIKEKMIDAEKLLNRVDPLPQGKLRNLWISDTRIGSVNAQSIYMYLILLINTILAAKGHLLPGFNGAPPRKFKTAARRPKMAHNV